MIYTLLAKLRLIFFKLFNDITLNHSLLQRLISDFISLFVSLQPYVDRMSDPSVSESQKQP
ncbi:MAG: hypothetical protein B7Y25_06920 [Alphaproteobacteria bacterium 16-39-46]|nr:MAG: hypothetical protein B7Y25_06920 [Alphaproteobacteria bacterium 16-39-46]OZA42144.1 MAG: hypothetical protein B7X84_06860 [Alphaproteobacteria bacterium 17-39-52]